MIIGRFYRRQKSQEEAQTEVNWLKNKFIDAMAEKREQVSLEEEEEHLKMDQFI